MAARLLPTRDDSSGAGHRGWRVGNLGRVTRGLPAKREQRCWLHKIAKVPVALSKTAHTGAKTALAEIGNAEDRRHALGAVKAFELGVLGECNDEDNAV